eukprot:scaffold34663_cov205-Amphora_coffeaeformis.AAC.5
MGLKLGSHEWMNPGADLEEEESGSDARRTTRMEILRIITSSPLSSQKRICCCWMKRSSAPSFTSTTPSLFVSGEKTDLVGTPVNQTLVIIAIDRRGRMLLSTAQPEGLANTISSNVEVKFWSQ